MRVCLFRVLALSVILAGNSRAVIAQSSSVASDETRFAVAYVEVAPASRSAMESAFRQYRDRMRSEAGYVQAELYEQAGPTGHFVVIETWKDQASLDAHATSAAVTSFRSALDPIRISGYDQRPYKPLSVASRSSTSGRPVYVITHVDVAPAGEAPSILRRLAEGSRSEPGCLRFDVLQHAMRANHFTVIEAWASMKDREAHAGAAATKKYRDDIQPLTGSPLDERIVNALQ